MNLWKKTSPSSLHLKINHHLCLSGAAEKPGASGVSGVRDVAPGSKSSTPPGTLNWSTSTALEVALQVIGALQVMDSQNFTSCHQSKPL